MKLTDSHIEEIKAAAERIGEYGKITLSVTCGVVDIITENRVRIQNGYRDSVTKQPGNSGEPVR